MENKQALVIVESPTKANTIRRFLPKNFVVKASIGHIRDLPKKSSEIPVSQKGRSWDNSKNLGVDIENEFQTIYITPKTKSKIIKELKDELKKAEVLYLATDEDREGESISFHLLEVLKPNIPVKRMVFHEITKSAILESLEHTRNIDENLVNAQETRRIVDRLFGFTVSSLIWEKISYGLSAGRVQSPALKMIVQREKDRMTFVSSKYYDIKAYLENNNVEFSANLISYKGKKIASSTDFSKEGKQKSNSVLYLLKEDAKKIEGELKKKDFKVKDRIERKFFVETPNPYITSTLQQDGSRTLGFTAKKTMQVAQRLYEKGYITYMRTDSYNLSKEAIEEARKKILKEFGPKYFNENRKTSKKSANSQEAHEAIRPSKEYFKDPKEIDELDIDEIALFSMIYKRTLASLMTKAEKESVVLHLENGDSMFLSSFLHTVFDGFYKVYGEVDKTEKKIELQKGDTAKLKKSEVVEHETKAPSRYTEASLIQRLEKEGIGRPSTYAMITSTLLERKYVVKNQGVFIPTYVGFAVSDFMEKNFSEYVNFEFTSNMENQLDLISIGKFEKKTYLTNFYLKENGLLQKTIRGSKEILAEDSKSVHLPFLNGENKLKIGKFGPYMILENGEHLSIPENILPFEINESKIESIKNALEKKSEILFVNDAGEEVYYKSGRYGFYLEIKKNEEVLRRITLPKNATEKDFDVDDLKIISLMPKKIATYKGEDVYLNLGTFGFYLKTNAINISLKNLNWKEIDENMAIELATKEEAKKSKMIIKDFGKILKRETKILKSKLGFYIKHGITNISLPKEYKNSAEKIEKMDANEIENIIKNAKKKN